MTTLDLLKGGKTSVETLHPSVIRTDGGTQMRAELNVATIDEYAQAMQEGARFPPIVVYYDGEHYWTGDGFHRLAARRKLFEGAIECEVRSGTRRDAVLHAAGANASHGLRRTNADKRRAVETLLRDVEWAQWSDREIARSCAVDHKTVGTLRRELSGEIPQIEASRIVHRNGTEYTVATGGISAANQGRKQRAADAAIDGQAVQPDPLANDQRIQSMDKLADEIRGHTNHAVTKEDAARDRQISRLSTWLVGQGWGIMYSPKPGQSYVNTGRRHATDVKFLFDRDDLGTLLSALLQAADVEHKLQAAQPSPPRVTDGRVGAARAIRDTIRDLLRHLDSYGNLTGKYTDIPPARRVLETMRDELQTLIDALGGAGETAPKGSPEEDDEYAGIEQIIDEGEEDDDVTDEN